MSTPQRKLLRDGVAWLFALLVLLGLVFVLEFNLIIGVVVAVLVFVGLYFILNPANPEKQQKHAHQQQTGHKLGQIKFKIWNLRNMTDRLDDPEVQNQLNSITKLGDDIVTRLENTGAELHTVTRMHTMFEQVSVILNGYMDLLTGKDKVSPEKYQQLKTRIEKNVLPQIHTSLQEFARDLSKHDIQQLETSMDILETTLKLEDMSQREG